MVGTTTTVGATTVGGCNDGGWVRRRIRLLSIRQIEELPHPHLIEVLIIIDARTIVWLCDPSRSIGIRY